MQAQLLRTSALVAAVALWAGLGPCAWAQEAGAVDARRISEAVDGYLGASPDLKLVGGPGSSGYADGFWIRGGQYHLRINALLQARYEAFDWSDTEPTPGGDRSGFSLPRAVLRFSGGAPCDIRWFLELDFGHDGAAVARQAVQGCVNCSPNNLGPDNQSGNFDTGREAWIEWGRCPDFNLRMGQIHTAGPRQLMTQPDHTQFVDLALASSWVGLGMPGYTDRNRDHGIMIHGALGQTQSFKYLFTITNGDGGDSIRNVLDHRTSDGLAFSGRLNWAFLRPTGYREGALGQVTCAGYGELGVWGFYYADRTDKPHTTEGDYLRYGVDLSLGKGGLSFTGAYSVIQDRDVMGTMDDDSQAWLLQGGFHIPGTAWELAARVSGYQTDGDLSGDGSVQELAFAVNYYLDGHRNKLQLEVARYTTDDDGFLILDPYAAFPAFLANEESAWRILLQWQLSL